jgi:hypothetical protein
MSWLAVGSSVLSIGGSLFGGSKKKKAAKKAAAAQRAALGAAESQYRDPSVLLSETYGQLYGPSAQEAILGAERRLMPQYQELQFERMGMLQPELMERQREFQEAELGLLGELAPTAREALEDPRLARIADISLEEAERLSGDLTPEEERAAEQRALQTGERTGRTLDASTIALGALGRQEARLEREAAAQRARSLAGQAAMAARIDPYTAILGRTPSAYQTAAGLSLGQLGTMTTSPGTAYNIGAQEDYRKAQLQLALGGVESAYQQAKGGIEAGMISGVASGLSGMLGSFGEGSTPTKTPTTQYNPFTTSTLGTLTPQVQLTGFMNQPLNQTSSQFFKY